MFISQGDPEEPPHAYGTHLALDIQRIVYIIMYSFVDTSSNQTTNLLLKSMLVMTA